MTDTDLLPCPFCGRPGKLLEDSDHHGGFFYLGCAVGFDALEDKCKGANLFYTAPIEELPDAIKAWNTRTPSSTLANDAVAAYNEAFPMSGNPDHAEWFGKYVAGLSTRANERGDEPVIGMIGHIDTGKTSLRGAIQMVMEKHTPQPSPQSEMVAVPRDVMVKVFEDIQAVTCDPTGTVCIHGSDGDRAVIKKVLSMLQPYTKGGVRWTE